MTLPSYSTGYDSRPEPGQCWVCLRRDSVPEAARGRVPELCSEPCRLGWVERYSLADAATHVAVEESWAPITAGPPIAKAVSDCEGVPVLPQPGSWWAGVRARWAGSAGRAL